jgi:hypothetical protein
MPSQPAVANLKQFLEELRKDIHESLCSTTAHLISALQERELEKARGIALQLFRDLYLCNNDRPKSLLSQILFLLYSDNLFLRCDSLSAWLVELDCELQKLRSWGAHVLPPIAMSPSAVETAPDEPFLWRRWIGGLELLETKTP